MVDVGPALTVPATLHFPSTLHVSPAPGVPAPNLPLAIDLLATLGLPPALHVAPAFAALCLGRAHR
jgi:hypothetical protein